MYYRVGWPFWRALARKGFKLKLVVEVMRDEEAGVFVASSKYLRGLHCEAETLDQLVQEVNYAAEALLACHLRAESIPKHPATDMRYCAA